MSEDAAADILSANPDRDFILQYLVSNVNDNLFEFGITLQARGILVSGIVISHKAYLDGLAATFITGLSKSPELVANFKQFAALFDDPSTESEGNETPKLPNFIHLKDAHFFGGGPVPVSPEGIMWRGRISEISGFSIGNYQSE